MSSAHTPSADPASITATTTSNNGASPISTNGETAPITSPVVDPNPATPATVVDPAATTVVTDPALAADPAPNGADKNAANSTPEWAQKRINELTAKRYEAQREADAAKADKAAIEARNAELLAQLAKAGTSTTTTSGSSVPPVVTTPTLTEEEIEQRVAQRAQEIAAIKLFNDSCNDVAIKGKGEFKDWDDAVKNLAMVGAMGKDVPIDFVETALELKDPHKVLHYLGTQQMEEAARIAALPPKKMALELARIEAKLNAPALTPVHVSPAISNAPPPVIPVAGGAKPGTPDINDPNISMADWAKIRSQQIYDKKQSYRRA